MKAAPAAIPASTGATPLQFVWINFFKAGALQLIVLHHLAFYGPMSDYAHPLMPAFIDWLDAYGRIAVQIFLVIGGFLAAKSLCPQGLPGLDNPLGKIWRRYAKLAPPFIVAMLLAVGASAWADLWMDHDSISAPPDMMQFTAHALLLQDVLDHEALSAGAWYVAIDFQLFALAAMLFWFSGRLAPWHLRAWVMPATVMAGVTLSLLFFNRDADWDMWAPYFFGSYGMGMLAWWASDRSRTRTTAAWLAAMILLPGMIALTIDYRSRIAVALAVACCLVVVGRLRGGHSGWAWLRLNDMARISYSVFLIHFPVCLVVNAAFVHFIPALPHWQALGMLVAWIASLAAGAIFYRWVEAPLGRILAFAREPKAHQITPHASGNSENF